MWSARPAVAGRGRWADARGPLVIDVDATLLTAHSEKDGAAATYQRGFGFHPLLAYLDLPSSRAGGLPLGAIQRPGNAGANAAVDHIEVLDQALAQLPVEVCQDAEILLRCDCTGATHQLLDQCCQARMTFSVGLQPTEAVRDVILHIPEPDWVPALTADGQPRDNGRVVEITDLLDLSSWPAGSRVIVRREHAHPGA